MKRDFLTDWLPYVDKILRSIGYNYYELDNPTWKELYEEGFSPLQAVGISEFDTDNPVKVFLQIRKIQYEKNQTK